MKKHPFDDYINSEDPFGGVTYWLISKEIDLLELLYDKKSNYNVELGLYLANHY